MHQSRDKDNRDRRRIQQLPEHLLKGAHRQAQGLPVEDIDRPLDNMFYPRIGGSKRDAKSFGHLFRLCGHITFSNDSPGGIDRVLAPDVDRSSSAAGHDHL